MLLEAADLCMSRCFLCGLILSQWFACRCETSQTVWHDEIFEEAHHRPAPLAISVLELSPGLSLWRQTDGPMIGDIFFT